jgi:hypothetical protein
MVNGMDRSQDKTEECNPRDGLTAKLRTAGFCLLCHPTKERTEDVSRESGGLLQSLDSRASNDSAVSSSRPKHLAVQPNVMSFRLSLRIAHSFSRDDDREEVAVESWSAVR